MPWRKQFKSNEEYNAWYREYREFNRDKMRDYNRKYNQKWRKENGYHNEIASTLKYPEKVKARRLLGYAIKKCKVLKAPCLKCGREDSQAHHIDYNLPYEVIWLCPPCHTKEHKKDIHRFSCSILKNIVYWK